MVCWFVVLFADFPVALDMHKTDCSRYFFVVGFTDKILSVGSELQQSGSRAGADARRVDGWISVHLVGFVGPADYDLQGLDALHTRLLFVTSRASATRVPTGRPIIATRVSLLKCLKNKT